MALFQVVWNQDCPMRRHTLAILVVLFYSFWPLLAQETVNIAPSIDGTYVFFRDSDGVTAPTEFSVTLTLSHGTATLVSTPPKAGYTDSGSYSYSSGKLSSFVLPRMGKFARRGSVTLSNGTLTLPFKLMSTGVGTSTWHAPKTEENSANDSQPLNKLLDEILKEYEDRIPLQVKTVLLELSGTSARKLLNSGIAWNMAGYIPEAAFLLARSARLDPAPPTLNNLAHVLSLDDEAVSARKVLLSARRSAPSNPYILNNLAFADYQLQRYSEAEMASRKAVSFAPEPDFYWNLCKILYAENKYGESRAACAEAETRGIKKMLYPGASPKGSSGKTGDEGSGGTPDGPHEGGDAGGPPAPDGPPAPGADNGDNRGEDLKPPSSNDDEAALNAAPIDPDSSIIGQIGKRDTANDGKEPKPYRFPRNSKPLRELNPKAGDWVGHWEGDKVMGCINRVRNFGEGLTTTKVHENLCHYAQKTSFDVDENGNITGKGQAIYVIYDKADAYATMMLPLPVPPGGFFATFPGGYRVREFDIEGVVQPDGTVLIGGRSMKPMMLLNVYAFTKVYPWNVFPPPADDASKPGVLQIQRHDGTWTMEATRRGIKTGMNYQTVIYKTRQKRNMVKCCRVYCEKPVEAKDSGDNQTIKDVKCSLGAGPASLTASKDGLEGELDLGAVKVSSSGEGMKGEASVGGVKISGSSENLSVEVDTGAITAKVGADYGKPGDIAKLMKAQQANSCATPEGVNENAGTESMDLNLKLGDGNLIAQNVGFSNQRNPITGDETFSVGFSGSASVGEGLKGEASWGAKLIVNSRCGFGVSFNAQESLGGEKSGSGDIFGHEVSAKGSCSLERSQEVTVWASSTILE
jgi:tetratricopeptide (TPR) repeat protein